MRITTMLKKLFRVRQDMLDCTQEINRVSTERAKVVAPIRKKIEERRQASLPQMAHNGNGATP
jgi:hypothetical protein